MYIKTTFLTNPERLSGNAKQYYEFLRKNEFLTQNNGIILFDTTSNLNLKNRINLKKNLQTCILEDCFLDLLAQPSNIKNIENLVLEVENAYKQQLDEDIEAYAKNNCTFVCDDSKLVLNLQCSSYGSTYGEMSSYNRVNAKSPNSVQIELSYTFEDFPGLDDDFLNEIQYCRVRFEAPKLLKYLKQYAADYLIKINKAKSNKRSKKDLKELENDLDEYIDQLEQLFPVVADLEEAGEDIPDKQPSKTRRRK